ncbi:DUF2306 domain-containing protein [Amycolatopsis sp. BJA-103]|uniref:DUF2306 domain-containing protein n=1 Tax=unclassified Amycolatopsis TaxID=2618356 RepID=UPI000C763296|nr:DUF2306 domain-containing protein [Amycolatopsis sp. BJA-103]AUI60111.1 hypothetical protein BKN51_19170 [Amycolatopsis sp. BJA-103]PNE14390.1 hypothetical protein B1H26_35115 [Amycolatopsis sp. BJA-103]
MTSSNAPRWWRRPWIVPLMLVAAAFLAFSVPPYLTFDPAESRLEAPPGNGLYYPLLVAHVLFGTVAMVTACFQIWPAFRARYRRGHRITGRIYVFAGALPAGFVGLYIGWHTSVGPSVRVANLVGSVLWIAVTVIGIRMARQRRFGEHRRWMSRSFALAMSIVLSRVINVVATIVLTPEIGTTFGGSEVLMRYSAMSIGAWLSPLLLLVLTDWVLERRKTPKKPPSGLDVSAPGRTPSRV